jgi:hypothetical protein
MGSLNSTGSVLSSLLQNLVTESPQLFSILSTPDVQSTLEKASPGDIAELSDQALQLQQVGVLFGNLDSTQSTDPTPSPLFSVLPYGSPDAESELIDQALQSSIAPAGTTGSAANNLQMEELNALFGTKSTVDPFINALGWIHPCARNRRDAHPGVISMDVMASEEDLKSEIERLRAENEALKKPTRGRVYLKVSEKGGLSVYGMGRFPITLYREQWEKLLSMADEIRAFILENDHSLKKKE